MKESDVRAKYTAAEIKKRCSTGVFQFDFNDGRTVVFYEERGKGYVGGIDSRKPAGVEILLPMLASSMGCRVLELIGADTITLSLCRAVAESMGITVKSE